MQFAIAATIYHCKQPSLNQFPVLCCFFTLQSCRLAAIFECYDSRIMLNCTLLDTHASPPSFLCVLNMGFVTLNSWGYTLLIQKKKCSNVEKRKKKIYVGEMSLTPKVRFSNIHKQNRK